jgi:hypothetical protein
VDVLATQLKVAECATGCTPMPDRVTIAGEFVASLVTVTLPVAFPVPAGVKVTLRVAVCPGVKIWPVEIPLAANPAPEMLTLDTVTFEFPALVNVTPRLVLLPMLTLLKFRLVVLSFKSIVTGFTVRMAGLLVTLPTALVTVTVNCAPLSVAEVDGMV